MYILCLFTGVKVSVYDLYVLNLIAFCVLMVRDRDLRSMVNATNRCRQFAHCLFCVLFDGVTGSIPVFGIKFDC